MHSLDPSTSYPQQGAACFLEWAGRRLLGLPCWGWCVNLALNSFICSSAAGKAHLRRANGLSFVEVAGLGMHKAERQQEPERERESKTASSYEWIGVNWPCQPDTVCLAGLVVQQQL